MRAAAADGLRKQFKQVAVEERKRLAEALRVNLKRRKAQKRERSADPSDQTESARRTSEESR